MTVRNLDNQPVGRVTAMPADANAYDDIFRVRLASLIDLGAGLVAARWATEGRAVSAFLHRPTCAMIKSCTPDFPLRSKPV